MKIFQRRRCKKVEAKRWQVLLKSTSKLYSSLADTVHSYPISDLSLRDLVRSPHKFWLLSSLYIENKCKHEGDIYTGLPHYNFMDTNTAEFVKNNINRYVSRYEVSSGHILQAVFDNFEWRTVTYFAVTVNIPEAVTVVRIREGVEKELVIEKRTRFQRGLHVNLGHHLCCMTHALSMTQRKELGGLVSIMCTRLEVFVENEEFVFRMKMNLPPMPDAELLTERYKSSLMPVIYFKNMDGIGHSSKFL